jgi:hypothetical protein
MCRVLSIANILKLDMRWRLGLNPTFKAKQRPNCFDIMIRGKIRHPDAVVLVQVCQACLLPAVGSVKAY